MRCENKASYWLLTSSVIFRPEIVKIGSCMSKFLQVKGGGWFGHRVVAGWVGWQQHSGWFTSQLGWTLESSAAWVGATPSDMIERCVRFARDFNLRRRTTATAVSDVTWRHWLHAVYRPTHTLPQSGAPRADLKLGANSFCLKNISTAKRNLTRWCISNLLTVPTEDDGEVRFLTGSRNMAV